MIPDTIRGASDGYEFALENQAGVAVQLSEDDRCALVTGLALHEKAKKTLAKVLLECNDAIIIAWSSSLAIPAEHEKVNCRTHKGCWSGK